MPTAYCLDKNRALIQESKQAENLIRKMLNETDARKQENDAI